MQISDAILERARVAIRTDGVLTESALRSLIDDLEARPVVHQEVAAGSLLYMYWHYWDAAEPGARHLLSQLSELFLTGYPGLALWAADAFAPHGQHAAPAGAPPVYVIGHDSRLHGAWSYHSRLVSGGSSFSTYYFRVFAPSGRFNEKSQAHFNDAGGNWAGSGGATTDGDPSLQGRWGTIGTLLILLWDDGRQTSYQFATEGSSLLLMRPGADNQLWKRQ